VTFVADIGDQLLAGMLTYGYPILGIALLLGAIGIPVPASLVATVAGTLLADGDLSPLPTVLVALAACVLGDVIGFIVGRVGGHRFARRHGRWLGVGAKRLVQAELLFLRWAGPTLLLSRSFLAIVAPAVNLLAGASSQKMRAFIAYDVLGRLAWTAIFVGLGYVFAGSAETAADFASSLSGLIGLGAVACLVALAANGSASVH
jgi:membrane protein DedA with SNARE-associated domain